MAHSGPVSGWKPRSLEVGLARVVLILVLAGCGSASTGATASSVTSTPSIATAPPGSVPATSEPSSAATTSPSPGSVQPTLEPTAVEPVIVNCGDRGRDFPTAALSGPGLAELGADPPAAILRSTLATAPAETPFPGHGWHRVLDDARGVLFVAAGTDGTTWWQVHVGILGGVLQAIDQGECRLAVTAPAGISYGRWWLDPVALPPSPETREVAILVRETACAGGHSPEGRVLAPTIVVHGDAIDVTIGIRQQPGEHDCPGNHGYRMRLKLPEALGARRLFDASSYPPRPATIQDPG